MRKRILNLVTVFLLIISMCTPMLTCGFRVSATGGTLAVQEAEEASDGQSLSDAESIAETGTETSDEAKTDEETETTIKTETQTETETEIKTTVRTETQIETETETTAKTEIETETEIEAEAETEYETETTTETETENETETEEGNAYDEDESKTVSFNAATMDAKTKVVINFHYKREDSDYDRWSLWLWEDNGAGTDNAFSEVDEQGAYFSMTAGSKTSKIGFIVRTPDWDKEGDSDRFVDVSDVVSGTIDVYITSGVDEVDIVMQDDVVTSVKIIEADYISENEVGIRTTGAITNTKDIKVYESSGTEITVSDVKQQNSEKEYTLILAESLDVFRGYYIVFQDITYTIKMPNVYSGAEFEDAYTYNGNDLGAVWTAEKTTFKVWAPTADAVKVCLYENGTAGDGSAKEELPMQKGEKGVWSVEKDGDQAGVYYTYKVSVGSEEIEACDPYAKAVGFNGDRAMVVNLEDTNPAGWNGDKNPNAGMEVTDAIVYELSVRDFSIDSSSGISEKNKGKYLAFTEHGTTNESGQTTGIDYIKDLGVTHIQLLPIQDFASVDEANPTASYNWGYETKNFNVPEGAYSTNPYDGTVRIKETKQMIKEIHDNGMSVVLDVVYNHVFNPSDYCYNKIVPDYFTRISEDGEYSDGSLCGNDTASERSMVRKYIVDSILYWAEEYHIDGFRFDLVGVLDTETINQIVSEVRAYDSSIILYGEGWTMGTVSTKDGTEFATQENASKTSGFGYFDDRIRYRIKGNSNDGSGGYATNGSNASDIRRSVQANAGWTTNPTQVVNYISCHDDMVLWDKIKKYGETNNVTNEDMIKKDKLASAVIFGSQGITFMHAGDEMLRTKNGEHDSYKSPDSVNSIKWNNLSQEDIQNTADYYKGLIAFRNAHKALRMTSAGEIRENLIHLNNLPEKVVAYTIDGANVSGEQSEKLLIAYNPNDSEVEIELPEGEWNICVNGENAGTDTIDTVSGKLSMSAISAYMLVQGEKDPDKQTVTVYYKTTNQETQMLYGLFGDQYSEGGEWDSVDMSDSVYPGYKRCVLDTGTAESVKVCFNDKHENWDNNDGDNYSIGCTGKYMIEDGKVREGVPEVEEEVRKVTVYYKTANKKSNILYGLFGAEYSADGSWGSAGMSDSSYEGYKEYTIDARNAERVQVCFNDTQDNWDNNGGDNYSIGCEGSYVVEDGIVRKGTPGAATIYYKTNNQETNMLYGLFGSAYPEGGTWKGADMEPSDYEGYHEIVIDTEEAEYVQVCFNDKHDNWDNNEGDNYKIGSTGAYTIADGVIHNGVPQTEEIRQIIIYYKTDNEKTNMLYGLFGDEYEEGGKWSGIDMTASDYAGHMKAVINIKKAETVQVCFNDKHDNWDNNGGENYSLTNAGSYVIKDGQIAEMENDNVVISSAALVMDTPQPGNSLPATVTCETDGVDTNVISIGWSPNDTTVKTGQDYTVTVVLRAVSATASSYGYIFADNVVVTVNDKQADIQLRNNRTQLEAVYTFYVSSCIHPEDKWELRNEIKATCTEPGYSGDIYCTVCNEKIEDGNVIPAAGHDYKEEWNNEDAEEHWHDCKNCDAHDAKQAHTFGEWNVTKEATETESGIQERSCLICGHMEEQMIPATGSSPDDNIIKVEKVILTPDSLVLSVGETRGLQVIIEPSNATNQKVTWSSDTKAAIVDKNGNVTAVSEGTAIITVTTEDGGYKAVCEVTVKRSGSPEAPENPDNPTIPDGLWIDGIDESGYAYTGTAIKPQVHVYDGKELLTEKKDYTISYKNNIKADYDPANEKKLPTIVVKGKGNYSGTETATFTISKMNIGTTAFRADDLSVAYNTKKVQKPVPELLWNGKKLKHKTDYTVAYFDSTGTTKLDSVKDEGFYVVEITGNGNFAGTRRVNLNVSTLKMINNISVSKIGKQTYTGSAITPEIKVKNLTFGVDYTVTYDNNVNIGTAYAIIKGIGDYSGTKRVAFQITGLSISKAAVEIASQTYSGVDLNPAVSLSMKVNGKTTILMPERDYIVSWQNNRNAGSATAVFTGINGYTGTLKKSFKIQRFDIGQNTDNRFNMTMESGADFVPYAKGGAKPELIVTFRNADDTIQTLIEGIDYTVSYKNNTYVNDNASLTVKGKGNFIGAAQTLPYKVTKQDISNLTLIAADKAYSDKKNGYITKIMIFDKDGKELKANKDYEKTIAYYYEETASGSAQKEDAVGKDDIVPIGTVIKVVVTGKGAYTGTIEGTYTITKKDFSKAKISIYAQEFTGQEILLGRDAFKQVKVGKDDITSQFATDYEIISGSYQNNIAKGTASVMIRGKGSYGGVKTVKFKITAKRFLWFCK